MSPTSPEPPLKQIVCCRKVKADLYIDDLNVGKLPDWGAIYEMIHNRWSYERYLQEVHVAEKPKKVGFWGRLLGRGEKGGEKPNDLRDYFISIFHKIKVYIKNKIIMKIALLTAGALVTV